MGTYRFRPAAMGDADMLLRWRNDPVTRANFKSTEIVERPDHMAWLTARLSRENPHLYVFERDGVPVATLRIDDYGMSYTVAPEVRRQGIATAMRSMAAERWGAQTAEIKPDNIALIKAAERAGHRVALLDHCSALIV